MSPTGKYPGYYFGQYGIFGSKFNYNKYPDGENCLYKTFCVTKFTTISGFGLACFHVNMIKHNSMFEFVRWFPRIMGPAMAMGATLGGTACYLTQLRGKDDAWNYYWAGGATGGMLGLCLKNASHGWHAAFYISLLAAAYKACKMEGHVFDAMPDPGFMSGDYDSISQRYDHSSGHDYGKLTGDEYWNNPRGPAF